MREPAASLRISKARLSPVPDCFGGALASQSISEPPDARTASSMPEGACATLAPGERAAAADAAAGGPAGLAYARGTARPGRCRQWGVRRAARRWRASSEGLRMSSSTLGAGRESKLRSSPLCPPSAYLGCYNEARPKEPLGRAARRGTGGAWASRPRHGKTSAPPFVGRTTVAGLMEVAEPGRLFYFIPQLHDDEIDANELERALRDALLATREGSEEHRALLKESNFRKCVRIFDFLRYAPK